MWNYVHTDELYHWGIKGQKWGERRYQNKDGSLTPAGEQRYNKAEAKAAKKAAKAQRKVEKRYEKAGAYAGKAKYYKDKGDEASKSARQNAESLEKAAKKYDKEGKAVRAMASRKAAELFRKKEANARSSFDEKAEEYMEASKYYEKKASKIATKKNVDLGKKRINSIMKKSSDEGYHNQELYEKNVEKMRKNRETLDNFAKAHSTSKDF